MVWYSMVGYRIVWYDMVWNSMVWYGTVMLLIKQCLAISYSNGQSKAPTQARSEVLLVVAEGPGSLWAVVALESAFLTLVGTRLTDDAFLFRHAVVSTSGTPNCRKWITPVLGKKSTTKTLPGTPQHSWLKQCWTLFTGTISAATNCQRCASQNKITTATTDEPLLFTYCTFRFGLTLGCTGIEYEEHIVHHIYPSKCCTFPQ